MNQPLETLETRGRARNHDFAAKGRLDERSRRLAPPSNLVGPSLSALSDDTFPFTVLVFNTLPSKPQSSPQVPEGRERIDFITSFPTIGNPGNGGRDKAPSASSNINFLSPSDQTIDVTLPVTTRTDLGMTLFSAPSLSDVSSQKQISDIEKGGGAGRTLFDKALDAAKRFVEMEMEVDVPFIASLIREIPPRTRQVIFDVKARPKRTGQTLVTVLKDERAGELSITETVNAATAGGLVFVFGCAPPLTSAPPSRETLKETAPPTTITTIISIPTCTPFGENNTGRDCSSRGLPTRDKDVEIIPKERILGEVVETFSLALGGENQFTTIGSWRVLHATEDNNGHPTSYISFNPDTGELVNLQMNEKRDGWSVNKYKPGANLLFAAVVPVVKGQKIEDWNKAEALSRLAMVEFRTEPRSNKAQNENVRVTYVYNNKTGQFERGKEDDVFYTVVTDVFGLKKIIEITDVPYGVGKRRGTAGSAPTPPLPTSTPKPSRIATIVETTPTRPPPATPKPVVPPEIPRPMRAEFFDDFNAGTSFRIGALGWGRDGWTAEIFNFGVTTEIKPVQNVLSNPRDWVNSDGKPRGNVMVVTIGKEPLRNPPNWPEGYWRAGYPFWTNNFPELIPNPTRSLEVPAGVEADVWVTPDIGLMGLLSVHTKRTTPGHNAAVIGFVVERNNTLSLIVRDGDGNQTTLHMPSGLWRIGEWNTLKFVVRLVDGKKRVFPYVNGYRVISDPSRAPLYPSDTDGAFYDAHGGVNLSTPDGNDHILQGGQVVNDNFRVFTEE